MKNKIKEFAKKRGTLCVILSTIVVLVMIARFIRRDYYAVFLCLLTLLLFDIPVFANKLLKVNLPRELEMTILLFVFSAEILGELGSFYTYIPWWDDMLHTINGFLMAAIGFSLIDILNNSPKFHFNLSPLFVCFVAFCFSMTIGVVWEFFEYAMDVFTGTDMQKDTVIAAISSVSFDPNGLNNVVHIEDIESTVLNLQNGQSVTIYGGYLDVGIMDTMKDLFVNCIGAVVFSVIGFFYLKGRHKGMFASKFIPQFHADEAPEEVLCIKEQQIEQERL